MSYNTKSLSSLHTPLELNPLFITGFTDGEGSFSISVRDIDKDTKKARVLYVFSIILHKKDDGILRSIQSTLGIGKIYKHGKEGVQFRVESKKELLILIEHFDKYPLITKKGKDFLCFKKGISLIKNKEHLTKEGLLKLVSLKALMGKGLTNELKAAFPNLLPANELVISDLTLSPDLIIDPRWLAGFISAEGCFITDGVGYCFSLVTEYICLSEEFIYADRVFSTGGVVPVSRSNTKFCFKKSINNRRDNRYYSTLRSPSKEDEEFYLWFVGFADGESNFSIVFYKDKMGNIIGANFRFSIDLHKDDVSALEYIKSKLNIGYEIAVYGNTLDFQLHFEKI